MRLPNKISARGIALALVLPLAGCGSGSGERIAVSGKIDTATANRSASFGPEADYPMVLGEPYVIDGAEYVPADIWNYDQVGYATRDEGEGGVTAAHRTLPLPSYVEVTALDSGKTALVRIERRGPMTGNNLVALSDEAMAQIGGASGTAVRVRRVNPPESERVLLRMGQAAPERLETPESLLVVLKRKLPERGSASLAQATAPTTDHAAKSPTITADIPAGAEEKVPAVASTAQAVSAAAKPPKPRPSDTATPKPSPQAKGLVVQAAAFSSEVNAKRAATALGGFVVPSGRFFRVQTGPYTSRGQANAALAKVKAAGYSDARVTNAG